MNVTPATRGPLTTLLRPISRLLRLGEARYFIGNDLEGNGYYEYPSRSGSQDPRHTRRVIKYREKQANYFDYDRSQLPIQWKMWLRHTRRVAPSLQELQEDRARILQLQENVRLIAIRDEEARQRMEQKRLEEQGEAVGVSASASAHRGQPTTSSAASHGVAGTPPQGQAPDQTKSEALASEQAPESAARAMGADQKEQAAPMPRPRSRSRATPIPTSEINDKGNLRQQQRRVPTSMTQSNNDASTAEGQRAAGTIVEEREADNDVWKASRERLARQDRERGERGEHGEQQRRGYSTIATPRVLDAFRRS